MSGRRSIVVAQKVLNPVTGKWIQVNGPAFRSLILGGWFYADEKFGRLDVERIKSYFQTYWIKITPDVLRSDLLRFTTAELMSIRHYIIHCLPAKLYVQPMTLAQTRLIRSTPIFQFPYPTSENRCVIVDSLVWYVTMIYSELSQNEFEALAREIEFPSLKTRAALAVLAGNRVPAIKMIESGGVVDVLTQRWFRYFVYSSRIGCRLDEVINLIKQQTAVPVPPKHTDTSPVDPEPTREEIELRHARAEQTADERFDDREWE